MFLQDADGEGTPSEWHWPRVNAHWDNMYTHKVMRVLAILESGMQFRVRADESAHKDLSLTTAPASQQLHDLK